MKWLARCWDWFLYLPKLQARFCLRVLERHGMFCYLMSIIVCWAPGVLFLGLGLLMSEWLERLNWMPGVPALLLLFVGFVVVPQFALPMVLTGSLFVKLLFKLEPDPFGQENRRKSLEKLKAWSEN